MYPGVLILLGLYGDMVVFVWNYHVLSLPDHVRFWNRNQNLWSRPRIYKTHSLISKDFDSVNRSFQLSKGLIPPIVLFKFEDVFFLNPTFGTSLSNLFLIMDNSIFLMAFSHSYCAMVINLSVKGFFILVGTCIRAIIITCGAFKSMIANSIDFVFFYTF